MRKHRPGAIIHSVDPEGIGAELGLAPGDRLISINNQPIVDLIDYSLLLADEQVDLKIERINGELWELEIEKDEDQGLGLEFEEAVFDGITPCANRCVFCFVDQMPIGQRPTLYVKDDDYRLSFLQGSYITLTNLRPADWKRLERLRLSPLYISVHATTPEVRQFLLGQPRAGKIMDDLQRLGAIGVYCHTQAVLCPGINDGQVLEATLSTLFDLCPTVRSLAVVPVGLTSFREGLSSLRRFSAVEALKVIETVEAWQRKALEKIKTRWVWATDEFYLQAGLTPPDYESYEEFEQLDNGVGLWRLFEREIEDAARSMASRLKDAKGSFGIITGRDALAFWEAMRKNLLTWAPGTKLDIYPVENRFFGPEVTVAGLVTGGDLLRTLNQTPIPEGQILLVPQVMIRRGETVFLDGVTIEDLESAISRSLQIIEVDGETFINALCQYFEEENE